MKFTSNRYKENPFYNFRFQDKEVLILGGGDGGLLKELLDLPKDQRPSFITMVDIDEVVMYVQLYKT